jgi:hypothetical protein
MEREVLLKDNIKEFYSDACDSQKKKNFTSAYILFFKALVAISDLEIFERKGNFPKNHSERFDLLTFIDPELKNYLSYFFQDYTQSYTSKISFEKCRELKEIVEKYGKGKQVF